MKIHSVKTGESIFSIARKYSASPLKIIENNDLKNPDLLAIGTELLILTPTRTYTVRGGDTISKIADRFEVDITDIYRNNPYLSGTDSIYPGQILSIKQDAKEYGSALSIGYLFDGYTRERLNMALHYATHLAVSAYKRSGGKLKELFSVREAVTTAKKYGKLPLMRIYDTSKAETLENSYMEEIIEVIKKNGFSGIVISANEALYENKEKVILFLDSLYERLKPEGLSLFIERDLNRSRTPLPSSYDGAILMYEKSTLADIPSVDAEKKIYSESIGDGMRAYIDLPSFAYVDDMGVTKEEALILARRGGNEILHDSERGICYFVQNSYKAGKKEANRVVFESLENIKAKLDYVYELGLMGISFDIMRVPVEYLMIFHSLFALPKYSL